MVLRFWNLVRRLGFENPCRLPGNLFVAHVSRLQIIEFRACGQKGQHKLVETQNQARKHIGCNHMLRSLRIGEEVAVNFNSEAVSHSLSLG